SVAAPDHILGLMPEIAGVWRTGSLRFIPDNKTTPQHTTGLKNVGHGGKLSPVTEHHDITTGAHKAGSPGHPQGAPVCPAALVAVIPAELGILGVTDILVRRGHAAV